MLQVEHKIARWFFGAFIDKQLMLLSTLLAL
jgi:hypothetical protein